MERILVKFYLTILVINQEAFVNENTKNKTYKLNYFPIIKQYKANVHKVKGGKKEKQSIKKVKKEEQEDEEMEDADDPKKVKKEPQEDEEMEHADESDSEEEIFKKKSSQKDLIENPDLGLSDEVKSIKNDPDQLSKHSSKNDKDDLLEPDIYISVFRDIEDIKSELAKIKNIKCTLEKREGKPNDNTISEFEYLKQKLNNLEIVKALLIPKPFLTQHDPENQKFFTARNAALRQMKIPDINLENEDFKQNITSKVNKSNAGLISIPLKGKFDQKDIYFKHRNLFCLTMFKLLTGNNQYYSITKRFLYSQIKRNNEITNIENKQWTKIKENDEDYLDYKYEGHTFYLKNHNYEELYDIYLSQLAEKKIIFIYNAGHKDELDKLQKITDTMFMGSPYDMLENRLYQLFYILKNFYSDCFELDTNNEEKVPVLEPNHITTIISLCYFHNNFKVPLIHFLLNTEIFGRTEKKITMHTKSGNPRTQTLATGKKVKVDVRNTYYKKLDTNQILSLF